MKHNELTLCHQCGFWAHRSVVLSRTSTCFSWFFSPRRARAVPAAGIKTVVARGSGGAVQLRRATVQCGRNWPASPAVAQPLYPHQHHTLADRRPGWQQGSLPSKYPVVKACCYTLNMFLLAWRLMFSSRCSLITYCTSKLRTHVVCLRLFFLVPQAHVRRINGRNHKVCHPSVVVCFWCTSSVTAVLSEVQTRQQFIVLIKSCLLHWRFVDRFFSCIWSYMHCVIYRQMSLH